ncbi:MAG: hypothetical protein LC100_07240 [Chitinophagales bacterium]|nr:hypothetical protein [Chitinophagales bacterium]
MMFKLPGIVMAVFGIMIFGSCKKKMDDVYIVQKDIEKRDTVQVKTVFNVEEFRRQGMTDYEAIQAACDLVPENSTLIFENKTYNIDHTVFVEKSIHFRGPATLRRTSQDVYHLASPAVIGDRQLVLNTTEGLKVRDYFIMTNGKMDYTGTTQINLITAIDGNVITTHYPVGKFVDGSDAFPAGTLLLKDVRFFWILNKNPSLLPTQSCSFINLTFDGNRSSNQYTYSWLLHYGIEAASRDKTIIDSCTFMNSPGETVLGHNLYISNSTFKDINSSAIHTSIDRLQINEDEIHSEFVNNYFENTNEIPTTIEGHSEGCITHSNSGGYYTAENNTFINVGLSVIGLLYPSVSVNDWGTSDILFTNNNIRTPGRMVFGFGFLPGKLDNVNIVDNKIYELNPRDWSEAMEYYPGVIIENQVNR